MGAYLHLLYDAAGAAGKQQVGTYLNPHPYE